MFWKKRSKIEELDVAPEYFMTFHEIAKSYGFESEEHEVTTEDGYILTMHRLYKKSKDSESIEPKKAVFMQHGFLDSSMLWVVNGKEYSPGFMLAE